MEEKGWDWERERERARPDWDWEEVEDWDWEKEGVCWRDWTGEEEDVGSIDGFEGRRVERKASEGGAAVVTGCCGRAGREGVGDDEEEPGNEAGV